MFTGKVPADRSVGKSGDDAARATASRLLGSATAAYHPVSMVPAPIMLRDPRPGDLGWIVHRHGVLYAAEHGYDQRFEGLVAHVIADFTASASARQRCWVAERDGAIVGSVFLCEESASVARLRLLYVEPSERGRGLGARLVDVCIDEARALGYTTLVLWTQRTLESARRIYEARGFALDREEAHQMFGPPLVAETWRLELRHPRSGREEKTR
jgi:GNAT superfamily N-acetyltransferase